jgi:hypothetical protein
MAFKGDSVRDADFQQIQKPMNLKTSRGDSAKRWGHVNRIRSHPHGQVTKKSAVSVHKFGNDKQHAQHSRKNDDSDSVVARGDISDFGNFQFIHKPFSQGELQMLKTITASSG